MVFQIIMSQVVYRSYQLAYRLKMTAMRRAPSSWCLYMVLSSGVVGSFEYAPKIQKRRKIMIENSQSQLEQ